MMKKLLLTLALLLWATTAQAQVTVEDVAEAHGGLFAGTASYNLSGLDTPLAGDVVACSLSPGSIRQGSSVVISSSGTTTALTRNASASINTKLEWWVGVASGSETNATVVFTLSGAANDNEGVACYLVRGGAADQSSNTGTTSNGSTSPYATGPITPTTAHNVVLWSSSNSFDGSWGNDGAYTYTDMGFFFKTAYRIQTSATAATHTITASGTPFVDAGIIAIAGAAGGGGGGCPGMLLRGVCE